VSAPESSVLYDALGPIGRRRVWLATWAALAVVAALAAVVGVRLADAGQFDWVKWSPLLDPQDAQFAPLWRFLGGGLLNTLTAAGLSIVIALVMGTLLAVLRVSAARWYRWAVVGVVELLRGVPVVIAIFFAARALPDVGINLPTLWYVVIGLVVYNAVVIAEIIRAGLASLPRGQSEAAMAIGLTHGQSLRLVLLPQAFRAMLPALISQLVVVVKDTSLGLIVSFPELLRRANLAIQTTQNPIQTLLVVAGIFIAINYSLSRLAQYLERRLSTRRAGQSSSTPGSTVSGTSPSTSRSARIAVPEP
jgi:glutamate transport system permease protein